MAFVSVILGCLFLLAPLVASQGVHEEVVQPPYIVRAIYSFGDSTIDVGNNNYLNVANFAKANFPPYGRDFDTHHPTGRYSNGRLVVDFLARKLLNYTQFPSPFLANVSAHILGPGINYASSDGGILPGTGQEFGPVLSLADQVTMFREDTMPRIRDVFEHISKVLGTNQLDLISAHSAHMDESLFIISTGSNDLLTLDALTRTLGQNNFLRGGKPNSKIYEQMYALLWEQINELYLLGVRKFVIIEIGALGCTPNNLFNYNRDHGECYEQLNHEVETYNLNMVEFLATQFKLLPDAKYMIAPTFDRIKAIATWPEDFGFKYNAACCGGGPYGGMLPCQQPIVACKDSNEYVWFDPFHPSQQTYSLISEEILESIDGFLRK